MADRPGRTRHKRCGQGSDDLACRPCPGRRFRHFSAPSAIVLQPVCRSCQIDLLRVRSSLCTDCARYFRLNETIDPHCLLARSYHSWRAITHTETQPRRAYRLIRLGIEKPSMIDSLLRLAEDVLTVCWPADRYDLSPPGNL